MAPKSRFASRGAFDALALEESDAEQDQSSETQEELLSPEPVATNGGTPSKNTRSARRSAKRNAARSSEVTDSENDLEVMTTRSGSRIRQPSVPNLQEERATSESNGRPKEMTDVESHSKEPIETEKQDQAPATTSIMASPPQTPHYLTQKAADESPSHAMILQQKMEDDREARKIYWKKIYERTIFTFLMIGGFVALVLLGHPYMIMLVLLVQILVYHEVTALFNIPGRPSVTGGSSKPGAYSNASSRAGSAAQSEDDDDDEMGGREGRRKEELWSKTLSWYFFAVSNYFLYGESLIYYFKHIVFVDAYFIPFARHHRFISFMLYVFGFMAFVSGLKRSNLKHQFGLFCWVHMSLFLTVYSSHFIVNNILEGLIWVWVPASLVICNDVFAYICGMMFGRTPLISLSPKKTVEGFVGAFIITEIFAYAWGSLFMRYKYMICPAVSLGMNAWSKVDCEVNPVFLWHGVPLPAALSAILTRAVSPVSELFTGNVMKIENFQYAPFQFHSLVMAAFASLVAPFGGFFASGFKRAFNIKDFGDSIPGHGGLTDRFDCQFLMGLFTYVYYTSIIREHHVTVGSVLQTVVTHLTVEDQLELYRELTRFLTGQGVKV
ncbi:hypothetical protein CBS101457_002320 [Exobasidium rhododendri]|nr:hypothetical protein CBS101457_002320 [Exobasidium rhododendri]